MKKSSRDRRVFRRLQRRSMPYQLIMTEKLSCLISEAANYTMLAPLCMSEMLEAIRIANNTTVDTANIQEAFHKVNEAFNNLSKVNIKLNPLRLKL